MWPGHCRMSSWATYPLTVLHRLARNFPEMIRGVDLVFESDLPSAAGLGSSSALMIRPSLLWCVRTTSTGHRRGSRASRRRDDLAAYAATVENGSTFRGLAGEGGVGTEGGSEDHTAILCSEPSRVAQAFCPTRRERSISFARGLVFAIGVSGVAARKTGEARDDYNRVPGTPRACSSCGATRPAGATSHSPPRRRPRRTLPLDCAPCFAAARSWLTGSTSSWQESTQLVPAGADELERGDLEAFGRTVARSQELAQRLLRNQVPETVALVRTARDHGAWAASAFGAGFGGSVWALVEQSGAHPFLDWWQNG